MCVESVGVSRLSWWEGRPEGGVGYATGAEGVSREIWLARTWRAPRPIQSRSRSDPALKPAHRNGKAAIPHALATGPPAYVACAPIPGYMN